MTGPGVFTNPYHANRTVTGRIVTVLQGKRPDRGLKLERLDSRAVVRGAIHELMVTNEPAQPGDDVDRVGLIGFFEVEAAGVILVGSEVRVDGSPVGHVCGFDNTHMPNHQNICIKAQKLVDAIDLGVDLKSEVSFHFRPAAQ